MQGEPRTIDLKLSREDAGIVMDALIEHLESTRGSESRWGYGSYGRIETCERIIKAISILAACSEVPNA